MDPATPYHAFKARINELRARLKAMVGGDGIEPPTSTV